MYAKCIQNVYKLCTSFRQIFVYIFRTKLKELFHLNFVYKMYTQVCRNVGTQEFCINFVYISSDKKNIIKVVYTICIQNSYRMYIQIIVCKMDPTFQHILTRIC